jgi:hypothetical protein
MTIIALLAPVVNGEIGRDEDSMIRGTPALKVSNGGVLRLQRLGRLLSRRRNFTLIQNCTERGPQDTWRAL